MLDLRPRSLRSHAADALQHATYDPRHLVLIHTAVSGGLALVLFALDLLLGNQITQTSGLSGITTTATLEFLQTLLMLLNVILLPVWELGFVWTALQMFRRQDTNPKTLTFGFRRFLPLLVGKAVQSILLMGAMTLGAYVGAFLFCLTPGYQELAAVVEPYLMGDTLDYSALMADPAVLSNIYGILPFVAIGAALLTLPLFYRLRLVDYCLMDAPQTRPFLSNFKSMLLMRGHRRQLLKLDLSFWWFYLLQALISLVSFGDVLLPALGVDLGMPAQWALFGFYLASLVLQLALYCWKKPLVATTYAGFYHTLAQQVDEPKPQ